MFKMNSSIVKNNTNLRLKRFVLFLSGVPRGISRICGRLSLHYAVGGFTLRSLVVLCDTIFLFAPLVVQARSVAQNKKQSCGLQDCFGVPRGIRTILLDILKVLRYHLMERKEKESTWLLTTSWIKLRKSVFLIMSIFFRAERKI